MRTGRLAVALAWAWGLTASPPAMAAEPSPSPDGAALVPEPPPSRTAETVPSARDEHGQAEQARRRRAIRARRARARRRARKKRRARRARRAKGDPACEFRTPIHEHEVVPGEQLGQIAGRYGVRQRDLLELNALSNPDLIHPGQTIRVCPKIPPRKRSRLDYVIQPGDTLEGIADQYDLTMREILMYQAGGLGDPDVIRVGDKLTLWLDGEVLPKFRPRRAPTGRLANGVQLPPGDHYHIKHPGLAYGTPKTVHMIQKVAARFRRIHRDAPKIYIGDISKRGGGRLPPHLSHRSGQDVDVGYVRKGPTARRMRFFTVNENTLDVAKTWTLIKSFLDTGEVEYIFVDHRIQKLLYRHAKSRGISPQKLDELFQYPRSRHRSHGIIRHWRGHDDHFHVRLR